MVAPQKTALSVIYAEEVPRWMPMHSDYSPTAFGLQYRKGLPEIIAAKLRQRDLQPGRN
jgi:hypothetical protein